MKHSTANQIIHTSIRNRNSGTISWILQAAINTPKCIIVSLNKRVSEQLLTEYTKMLETQPRWKRLLWTLFGRK